MKKRTPGDLIEIKLNDHLFTLARVLESPLYAFYDFFSTEPILLTKEIEAKPILFKIWMSASNYRYINWRFLKHSDLEVSLREEPSFFKVDPISKVLAIYSKGSEFPASKEACEHLECAAVWEPEHVESE